MTDKLLTKAEWEVIRDGKWEGDAVSGRDLNACMRQVNATMDTLFAYRERTKGMWDYVQSWAPSTDAIAVELGLE